MGVLGANPKKEKAVAKLKKKKKSSRPSAKAKANRSKSKRAAPKRKQNGVSLATLKSYLGKKKKSGKKHKSRGNPNIMGVSGKEALASSAAVLGAVTIAKLLPAYAPANWMATDMGRFGTTLLVAAGEVIAAHFLIPRYRTLVLAGAGAQTLSMALNPLLRKVSVNVNLGRIRAGQPSLRDFVQGSFPEPHNPIWQQMAVAGVNSGAMGSGYSPRY